MSDDVDEIVKKLSEEEISKVGEPHREARKKFASKTKVADYKEFIEQIAGYVQHHRNELYGVKPTYEMALGEARALLDQFYQREGGFTYAFDLATRGRLDEVLDKLRDAYIAQDINKHKSGAIGQIDPLDFEQQKKAVGKVIESLKKHLPDDYTGRSAEELAYNYENVLKDYADIRETAGRLIGKKYTKKLAA